LIFGEIIPQSVCGRYALYIASKVTVPVNLLIYIMYPLVFPISKLLDHGLGQDLGLVYTNQELQNLVNIHEAKGNLPSISASIMQGALDFTKLTVERVMTKWNDVFFLRHDALLDFLTLEKIFKSGHSRVPVLNTRAGQVKQADSVCPVIGLLFVKDLILLDPEDELPVQYIIDNFCHDLKHVDLYHSVDRILDDFRTGRSHLAIVQKKSVNMVNGVNIYENVGIITLEDILENILKMDISDEFDVSPTESRRNNDALRFFDYRRTRGMDAMPPQERTVVYRHLCKEMKVFTIEHRKADDLELQNLLEVGTVWKIILDVSSTAVEGYEWKNKAMIEDGGHVLYSKGLQSEFFTFILDGKAEVFSGRQMFRTEVSRFTILFPEILSKAQEDYSLGFELSDIVPDFSARVIQNSRILRISRMNFVKCLEGKLRNYYRPSKTTEIIFDQRTDKFSTRSIESFQGLNTVAPEARNQKNIESVTNVAGDNSSHTKYICREHLNYNANLSMENIPESSNFAPVLVNNDVVCPGEKIHSVDIANIRAPLRHTQRVGVWSSAESDEGAVDEGRSIPPIAMKVRIVADSNSNH